MVILQESCPNDWEDLLLKEFIAPLRAFHSNGHSRHKRLERGIVSWTEANDDIVVEVKQ